ncbi:Ulp1 family isopeptidase, partial [Mesorhizobium sp. 14Arga]
IGLTVDDYFPASDVDGGTDPQAREHLSVQVLGEREQVSRPAAPMEAVAGLTGKQPAVQPETMRRDGERDKRKATEREEGGKTTRRRRSDAAPPHPLALGAIDYLGDEHITADYNLLGEQLQRDNPYMAARTRFVQPAETHLLRWTTSQHETDQTLAVLDEQGRDTSDFLFLPVNNATVGGGGTHWSLMLVDRRLRDAPVAYHYDSAGGANSADAQELAKRLRARLETVRMAQQQNGYDCGVFVLEATRALVGQLAQEGLPTQRPRHLDNLVGDRRALQDRIGPHPTAMEESRPQTASSSKPKRRNLKRLAAIPELVNEAVKTSFQLSRVECEGIGNRIGGVFALNAFVDNAEELAQLEFGGHKLSKDDILKMLSNQGGGAQAVRALLKNAEALATLELSGQKLNKDDIVKILRNRGVPQVLNTLLGEHGKDLTALELSGQKLSKNEIIKILGNEGGAQTVKALLDNSRALAELEFGGQKLSKDDILKVVIRAGAAQAVTALLDNAQELATLEFNGQKLSKDDVLRILGNEGGAQALKALLGQRGKALADLELSGQKLGKDDVIKILDNHGGAQALNTLLGEPGKDLAALELSGQKLSKDDVLRILGNNGARKAVRVLLDNAEKLAMLELSGHKLSKDDVIRILGNEGGARALQALLGEPAKALATLEFGGQKLSKNDIVKILSQPGGAETTKALLGKADKLTNTLKSKVLAAASKRRGAPAAIRNLK